MLKFVPALGERLIKSLWREGLGRYGHPCQAYKSLRRGEVILVPDTNLWLGKSRGDGLMQLLDKGVMVGCRKEERWIKEATDV